MTRIMRSLLSITAVLLAGCTLAPKYTRPEAPVPGNWPSGPAYKDAQAAHDAPAATVLAWREFFTDERLQKVIETALNSNRDLRTAALNVERARALYGIQRAELLPTVNAAGNASAQRVPTDLSSNGAATTSRQYGVNLGIASWEIDFFGRIRSLKDKALEEYLATAQARHSAQILLVSGVANAYLTLAADRENLRLAQDTLENQRSAYDLIRRRYEAGILSELDTRQAQTRVDAARVDVALFSRLTAQDENALNLLAGSPVPGELLPPDLSAVSPFRGISPGMSSDVLLRRPDILQAESLLKAANANIGAARAALFPRISLTAAAGTASSELSGLFRSGSGAWNYSSQVVSPIFDARAWSALEAVKVEREIALAQYEKAIQSAFREVADALAVRGTVDEQLVAQTSFADAVAETYRLSNARYTKGIDSFLGVLDAQRSLYAAQQGLISIRLAKLANQVQLYAVLGGGA
ncbi:efflux transporter outer membrane subunit [Candidatus Deferrimicrobium sp.]|uniref:efflux transporter outer membrane subunit n=1 Tax=Candidatus Deferrimicrobium sp. TaxID=3060586 RepID=UPI003C6B4FC8